MVKQSPSRNHRSKGIKVKHALQICVLVAICFWLIYQVKHSHDKKAFEEHDAKMSVNTHISDEVLKFGRKDLQPRLEETTMKHDKLDEEQEAEEETGGGGKEGNKNEEEGQEEEDNNNEDVKGGDDEIDEGDQDKFQLDDETEEDLIDGEKDREESDEKEAAENDSEDKEGRQNGNTSSLEDRDRDGGSSTSNRNAHEAREEHYRADDASSAVTHETKTERGTDNSNDNTETNIIEEEGNNSMNTTGLKVEKGGMGEDGISPNVTGKGDKGSEIGSFESEGGSHLNSAMSTELNNQPEMGNNLLLQNETETRPETDEAQNATVKNQSSTNYMISSNTGNADAVVAQNATVKDQSITNFMISNNTGNANAVVGESSNPAEFAVPEKVKVFNTTSIAVEGHSGSLTTEENADRSWNEKSETGNGTEKIRNSSQSGNADVVQHDSSESSIPLEEKDVRTNGTFPEITTERTNNGDAAAQ